MKKVTNSGSTGDHIITMRIEVPMTLTAEESEALKKYAKLRDE